MQPRRTSRSTATGAYLNKYPQGQFADQAKQQIAALDGPALMPPKAPLPEIVATTAKLYARGKARLRDAPATAGAVLAQLAAGTSLDATGRSADGAWWRVTLADGRSGFVAAAVVDATAPPPPAVAAPPPAPVAAVAPAAPAPDPETAAVEPGREHFVCLNDTTGKPAERMVACRRLLKAGLSDETERYNAELMLGDALNTLGKSAEAVDAYNAAIEIDPKFYSAYYGLGLVRLNAGRYAEARAALDKAVALNPKDANSLYQRGTALSALGDFAAGRADVESAIALNAGDTSYYEQLAAIHLAEGDPEAALAAVEQATKVDPGYWGLTGMITHYLAGAFDRTKAMAAAAIKDAPDYPYTYIWKALAQKAAGDNAAAVATLDAGKMAVGKTDWPVPVMDYLAGRISESKLRALAQSADAKTEAERLCEANFYIGEAAHLAGDRAAAKAALQAAVDTRIYHYLELAAAKARLAQLQ